jgi:hypothetical protein
MYPTNIEVMDTTVLEKPIKVYWPSPRGFGNALIMSHIVHVLNDNGLEAYFKENRVTRGLVDVPIYSKEVGECVIHTFQPSNTSWKKNVDRPSIIGSLSILEKVIGRKIIFDRLKHNYVPVKFIKEKVPSVDVAMCTQVGNWQPYRQWPYFEELKIEFDKAGISYIDLNKEKIFSNKCLNYVNNAKLYLGMDTGMSHYVSKFANGKTIILQSGISPFWYWSYPYDYNYIKAVYICNLDPCFINHIQIKKDLVCPYDHRCMTTLSVERVFTEIKERL